MKFINSPIQSQQPQAGSTRKRTEPQYVRVKLLEPTIKKKKCKAAEEEKTNPGYSSGAQTVVSMRGKSACLPAKVELPSPSGT